MLRVLLERVELLPTEAPDEPWAFRGIVWAPGGAGRVAVRRREPERVVLPAPTVAQLSR